MEADAKAARLFTTPGWTTRAILPHLLPWLPTDRDPVVVEPAAGDGAIVRELIAAGIAPRCIQAGERDIPRSQALRALGLAAVYAGDVLTCPHVGRRADLVVMNPPFELAPDFVSWALEAVGSTGTVACLLLLSYLETPERGAWHRAHPSDLYVLERRPAFDLSPDTVLPRCRGCSARITGEVKRYRVTGTKKIRTWCAACAESGAAAFSGELIEPRRRKARAASARKPPVDMRPYGWFVWGPGVRGNVRSLECEPSERRAKLLAKLPPAPSPAYSSIDAAAERRRLVDASVAKLHAPEGGV